MAAASSAARIRGAVTRGLTRVYEVASRPSSVRLAEQIANENRTLLERLAALETRFDGVLGELAALRSAQEQADLAHAAAAAEAAELNRALVDSIAMLSHALTARPPR